jgi:hypothetical protein
MLRAELPEGLLKFTEKAIDLGTVPCGVPQTCSVTLKNYGTHEAAFQVRAARIHTVSASNAVAYTLGTYLLAAALRVWWQSTSWLGPGCQGLVLASCDLLSLQLCSSCLQLSPDPSALHRCG